MKKTLLRASAANNKRSRIAEQCFRKTITVYKTIYAITSRSWYQAALARMISPPG